jgi:hypothetical protein
MRNFLFAASYAERHRKTFFGVIAIGPRNRSDPLRSQVAEFSEGILLPEYRERVAFVEYERYIELLAAHGSRDGKDLASFLEERLQLMAC